MKALFDKIKKRSLIIDLNKKQLTDIKIQIIEYAKIDMFKSLIEAGHLRED